MAELEQISGQPERCRPTPPQTCGEEGRGRPSTLCGRKCKSKGGLASRNTCRKNARPREGQGGVPMRLVRGDI